MRRNRLIPTLRAGLVAAILVQTPAPLLVGVSLSVGAATWSGSAEARVHVGRARVSSHRTVDRNVNRNVHRNVDIDVDWDRRHYPVARGIAAGVAVGVTAAAVGSIVYALPGGCESVVVGGIGYRRCGGAWYAPRYQGSRVVYVVVNAP